MNPADNIHLESSDVVVALVTRNYLDNPRHHDILKELGGRPFIVILSPDVSELPDYFPKPLAVIPMTSPEAVVRRLRELVGPNISVHTGILPHPQ